MTRGPRMLMRDMAGAVGLLWQGVTERAFPGGVLAVGRSRGRVHAIPFGMQSYAPRAAAVTRRTIYDLASLTKVLATTTIAMRLTEQGQVDIELPVKRYVPEFRGGWRDGVLVRHLLSHSSGLPWWGPLYRDVVGREAFLLRICRMRNAYPAGARASYSDLGFILLGEVLARASGKDLRRLFDEHVAGPLDLESTRYLPPVAWRSGIAPTEQDPWRGRLLRGEVHDENAAAMGGVSAHAGLFGTAEDLGRFAQCLLRSGRLARGALVGSQTLRRFTANARVPGGTRGLGWDTTTLWIPGPGGSGRLVRTRGYSSAGRRLSRDSFGHTGFTGTSLWVDPRRDLFVCLLTNRVHPERHNDAIRRYRALVADEVAGADMRARRRVQERRKAAASIRVLPARSRQRDGTPRDKRPR
jgi:CubicO group peptidase (beta-lactamase class C family)